MKKSGCGLKHSGWDVCICVYWCGTEQTLLWLPLLRHNESTDLDYSLTYIANCNHTQYCCVNREGKRRDTLRLTLLTKKTAKQETTGVKYAQTVLSTKQRSQGQANQAQVSHLLSLTMSRMCMSTHIQGQAPQIQNLDCHCKQVPFQCQRHLKNILDNGSLVYSSSVSSRATSSIITGLLRQMPTSKSAPCNNFFIFLMLPPIAVVPAVIASVIIFITWVFTAKPDE